MRIEVVASALLAVLLLAGAARIEAAPGVSAERLVDQGIAQFRKGQLDAARQTFRKAVAAARPKDRTSAAGVAHKFLGNIALVGGDLALADREYQIALKIFRAVKSDVEISNTLSNLATLAERRNDYARALALYTEVLALDRKRGDSESEALTRMSMGSVLEKAGRGEEAIAAYQEAQAAFTRLGDVERAALCAISLGNVAADAGRAEEAEKQYRQAMDMAKAPGLAAVRARALYHVARLEWAAGSYTQARLTGLAALQAATSSQRPAPTGEILNLLGLVAEDLGQHVEALSYYRRAVQEFGADREALASTLENIGNVHLRAGALDEAAIAYNQALEAFRAVGNRGGAASARNGLGVVAMRQGKWPEAVAIFEQARGEAVESKNAEASLSATNNLAFALLKAGRADDAAKASDEAVKSLEGSLADSSTRLAVLALRGSILAGAGRRDQALATWKQAIQQVEETRGRLRDQRVKSTFLEDKAELYELVARLLVDMSRDAEAFEYLERARSRAFLDLIGTQAVSKQAPDPRLQQLIERETLLQQSIARATRDDDLRKAIDEHTKVLADLRAMDPEYASQRGVDPVQIKRVQELLGSDTALVEYFLGRGGAMACVITSQSVKVVHLPMAPDKITDLVRKTRDFIAQKGDKTISDWQRHLAELYQGLWKPVEPLLGGRKRVCVVPHGALHYLPFQALVVEEDKSDRIIPAPHFLVQDYTLFYDPSASVLMFARQKNPGKFTSALVLGNAITELPPLESAEVEARAIAEILPRADVYIKEQATETLVKQQGAKYGVVHLATHGELLPDRPMESRILLTRSSEDDGYLTVKEIFGLRLDAYLVVLSACETGEVASVSAIYEYPPGDDLVGLTRSFLYAGTPTVIASLWPVDDRATSVLMKTFYEKLKTVDKAEALRQGQLQVLDMGRREENILYTHPNLWAPFIVVGDYK